MKTLFASLGATTACLLVLACSPTTLCGCSPPVPNRILEGTVRTDAGATLADIPIGTRALLADCSESEGGYVQEAETTSGADGSYEVWVYADLIGPTICVEVTAVRTVGTVSDTITAEVVTEVSLDPLPPVTVDLVFPG